jgi:signal transduction histidine kinase
VQGEGGPRRSDGAGLGLTLVRRLARLMGGDVRCESTTGKGTTFTLWIDAGPAR